MHGSLKKIAIVTLASVVPNDAVAATVKMQAVSIYSRVQLEEELSESVVVFLQGEIGVS